MFRTSLRLARAVPRLSRGYAEGAADSLKLNFVLPNNSLYKNQEVTQVNLPTTSGDIGILASHVPTLEELKPGVVEVIKGGETKEFFVAGGFASIGEDSILNVNAVEAYPLEDFSAAEAKNLLATAQKNVASSNAETAAEAAIEVEVLEALVAVAK